MVSGGGEGLTDAHELFGHVLACSSDDGCRAAGVAFEEVGAVVDLAVDHEPRVLFALVVAELLDADFSVDIGADHADLLHRLFDVGDGFLPGNLVAPEPIGEIASLLLHSLHPPAGKKRGLGRMLESQHPVFLVDHHPIPRVVHHPEDTPVHVLGLHVHRVVHAANHDVPSFLELRHGNVKVPEAPAEACVAR